MDAIKTISKIINQYTKHYPITLAKKINIRNYIIHEIIRRNNLIDIAFICKSAIIKYYGEAHTLDIKLYEHIIKKYVPPKYNIIWLFDMFLKKNGIYREYNKEFKNTWTSSIETLVLTTYPQGLIRNSFTWSQTAQGREFWREINKKYEKFIIKKSIPLNETETNKLKKYITWNQTPTNTFDYTIFDDV